MSSTAKLGAFILAALIILGFFIMRIERISLGGRDGRREVKARFASVAGLDAKSPVRIAGVRVGLVETIELARDRAVVDIDLDPGVQLRVGASARVRAMGILGEQYIEIDPGPEGNPPLPPGTVLEGTTPAGMDTLFDTAANVGGDLESVTENLRRTLGGPEGERRMQEILENIRELTLHLKLVAAENRGGINQTVDNVEAITAALREELPRLAARLNDLAQHVDELVVANRPNVDETMGNVKDLTARLRTSADNLNDITGKISRGEGSIGKLINDTTTVDNLNSTLKSVEGGVATLQETIGRAGRWQLFLDMRAEDLPRIDDSRTTVNAELHTTADRFYRVGVVSSPFGASSEERTETITTTDPDGTSSTVTIARTEVNDDWTFNAQVGYKIGKTTFRAGLFESEGGVGVDQRLFRDRLGLTLEAYNWGRDLKPPHIRFEGRWFLTPHIYGYTGIDDIRWSERRSAIIGAGITWKDEDLKYLLGTAASFAN